MIITSIDSILIYSINILQEKQDLMIIDYIAEVVYSLYIIIIKNI